MRDARGDSYSLFCAKDDYDYDLVDCQWRRSVGLILCSISGVLGVLQIVERHEEAMEECQSFVRKLCGMRMKIFYAKMFSYTPLVTRKGSCRLVHDPTMTSDRPAFLIVLVLKGWSAAG